MAGTLTCHRTARTADPKELYTSTYTPCIFVIHTLFTAASVRFGHQPSHIYRLSLSRPSFFFWTGFCEPQLYGSSKNSPPSKEGSAGFRGISSALHELLYCFDDACRALMVLLQRSRRCTLSTSRTSHILPSARLGYKPSHIIRATPSTFFPICLRLTVLRPKLRFPRLHFLSGDNRHPFIPPRRRFSSETHSTQSEILIASPPSLIPAHNGLPDSQIPKL